MDTTRTNERRKVTDWKNIDLDFLDGKYEFHTDDGKIRDRWRNVLAESKDENPQVTVNTKTAGRLRVAKALLIGMAALGAKTPALVIDVDPETMHKIERFQACNVPFQQCPNCGEPIPYRLKAYWPENPTPEFLSWRRDRDAELRHQLGYQRGQHYQRSCWEQIMQAPPTKRGLARIKTVK